MIEPQTSLTGTMPRILESPHITHDSAAALVSDGDVVAAAQEERFSRKKFDESFPHQAIRYCLETAGVRLRDIDNVVFYDKPFLKFERLLETYLAFAPARFASFVKAMPLWLSEKLFRRACSSRNCARSIRTSMRRA